MTTLSLLAVVDASSARQATFGAAQPGPEDVRTTAALDVGEPARAVLARRRERLARTVDETNPALVAPGPGAAEAAAVLGVPWIVDDRFREPDFGRWQGKSLEEVAESDPDGLATWARDVSAAPHDGESLTDLVARLGRDVLGIQPSTSGPLVADARGRRLGPRLAIASPLVVRALVTGVLEAGRATPGDTIFRIDVEPWSLTTLTCHHGRWNLRLMG
jgi:broad specificity phosphatase PhoE